MLYKALEQKNRIFFMKGENEFSFQHEALSWLVGYVLGKRGQSPESNCAFSQHCDLKLSHLIANFSVSPTIKMNCNNPYHHILEWGVVKLNKIMLAKCFELFR